MVKLGSCEKLVGMVKLGRCGAMEQLNMGREVVLTGGLCGC